MNSDCLTGERHSGHFFEEALTACIFHHSSKPLELELNPRLADSFRKIIIAVEVPAFDRNAELAVESYMTRKWKVLSVPPLRLRKSEAFPLLCYWHQRLTPDVNLDRKSAQGRIGELGNRGFPGNVGAIVELARELAEL